jgi:subfamily B ATP-binding cassette protein MsbA
MINSIDNAGGAKTTKWTTYKRLIYYARPYTFRLFVGSLCGVLFAGSTIGFLPAINKSFEKIFNFSTTNVYMTLSLAALFPVLAIIRGIGSYVGSYLIQWVGNRVVMDLRIEAYTHLQDLSVSYFDQNKTGEMISRTVNDTTLMERAVSTVLTDLVRQPFILAGAAGYLFYLNWKLALTSFIIFPICIMPVMFYGRKVRRAAKQGQERLAEIVSLMQEDIVGVRIVKAFCMEGYELDRFSKQCGLFFSRIMRVVRAKALIEPVVIFISMVGIALAFVYASAVKMPWQDFLTFALALVVMYDPAKKLSNIHLTIQHSSAAADRVFEILDTEIKVKEKPGAAQFSDKIREVKFDHVSFAYAKEPVLVDFDLLIKAGERIAFVGSSGAGKTTLVNLLPRFFDVTGGRVLLNGIDVRDISLKSLRSQIGLVTQETFLFNDTIARNISYGYFECPKEVIENAAKRAHAHEFIMEQPNGYNSVIGERGVRLSGGQRQRLAIARAILKDPPILILDEATSALDTESERLVQAALDDLMKGRTVLAIAHRLSTISNCHRIIVLDRGRIVEQGTHSELLARGGVYKRLSDLQFDLARGEA